MTTASEAEQIIATGFLALGSKAHDAENRGQFVLDVIDEQIEATTRAFLGLTVACARCHDHKMDPIPQREYYALSGIFRSTQTCSGTLAGVFPNFNADGQNRGLPPVARPALGLFGLEAADGSTEPPRRSGAACVSNQESACRRGRSCIYGFAITLPRRRLYRQPAALHMLGYGEHEAATEEPAAPVEGQAFKVTDRQWAALEGITGAGSMSSGMTPRKPTARLP